MTPLNGGVFYVVLIMIGTYMLQYELKDFLNYGSEAELNF